MLATEFIKAFPLYLLKALSIALILEVSICKGKLTTAWIDVIAFVNVSTSFISGMPTLTSKISTFFSCCVTASFKIWLISLSINACLNFFLPVGLILSPIKMGFLLNSTVCVPEETMVLFFFTIFWISETFSQKTVEKMNFSML